MSKSRGGPRRGGSGDRGEAITDPRRLFASDGPLASRKPGYSERPEQVDLAAAVEECFDSKSVLLADAPTGTGKSLGYLAPAILRAAQRGEKVVVSTATLALQAQLLNEDLPPLKSAAGVEFYGIMDEGGFDVIVGNPPYIVYSPKKVEYNLEPANYATHKTKNLYAYVFERSLSLAHRYGSVGLIVQFTSLSSKNLALLQNLLLERRGLRAVPFPRRPESVFDGVEML